MALTNQTNIKELADGGDGGTRLGASTSDKIGFHGTAPTAQTSLTALATDATIETTTASVREIITLLQAKGLAG